MDNITCGRNLLRDWEESKPDNFYTADVNLGRVMRRYLGEKGYAQIEDSLKALGGRVATIIDQNTKLEDRIGNHPRLERWSNLGERVEEIEFHPVHYENGRLIWESGIMAIQAEPGHNVHQMGLYYLLSHNGENGHMCSLACTAGLIRALQRVASDEIRQKFLPPLLDRDYDAMQHGAQFLTEVQGGSDVGANAVTATDNGDGTWRINGEKWFCSNINSDQFLMTARPEGAQQGTRGLGLFLVPRKLDDGRTNGFYIRRLKDKLGTRTLASAEVDFVDAVAYPVGELDKGFKHTVEIVLNTSRLMNAVACAAVMRRAYIEAATYACAREAFGSPIISYPMVQEAIADIQSEYVAATASGFALAHLLDKIEGSQASEDDHAVYRMLVNINKYITSIRGSEMVHRAIEVLGGNGAIEDFSILPRLYRDMVVLESWEGSHNVLCVQVWRDMLRYKLHEPFLAYIRDHLAQVTEEALQADVQQVQMALERVVTMVKRLVGDENAQAHLRRMVDTLAYLAQASILLAEAQWELDQGYPTDKPDLIRYFVNRHLNPDYDPLEDDEYLARLEGLMSAI